MSLCEVRFCLGIGFIFYTTKWFVINSYSWIMMDNDPEVWMVVILWGYEVYCVPTVTR